MRFRCRGDMFSNGISGCVITPNGDKVITAHHDAQLKVWDAQTGKLLHTLVHTPHYHEMQTGVLGCAISPDGALAASAGADHNVKLWDIASGQELATFEGHTDIVRICAFSPPDGRYLASGGDDCQVLIWKLSTRPKQKITMSTHTDDIKSCAVSPDGAFFVTAGADKTARVWNMETCDLLYTLSGHGDEIRACAVSPDSTVIITGADNETICVWNAHTGKKLAVLGKGLSLGGWIINDCAFGPDGTWFVSALDHRLELRNAPGWSWKRDFRPHDEIVQACAVSPDGKWIASAGDSDTINIWNPATAQLLQTLESNHRPIRRCAVSPDGTFLVTAESDWVHLSSYALASQSPRDCSLLVWDTNSWQLRQTLRLRAKYVIACAVTPDGASIIAASDDGTIKFWDATAGREQTSFTAPGTLFCLALHPCRPFAVGGGLGGAFYPMAFETIRYGPIIVTAYKKRGRLAVRCPICGYPQLLQHDQLGQEIICSVEGCSGLLHVNPFILSGGASS